jgi:hypothetical protein
MPLAHAHAQIESCKSGTCSGNFVDVEVEVPKSLNSLKASLSEILQICKAYKVCCRYALSHAQTGAAHPDPHSYRAHATTQDFVRAK